MATDYNELGRCCEHGQLARSCEICDLQKQVRDLQARNVALAAEVTSFRERSIAEILASDTAKLVKQLDQEVARAEAAEARCSALEAALREIADYKHSFGGLTAPTAMALSVEQALTALRYRARQALASHAATGAASRRGDVTEAETGGEGEG